MQLNSLMIKVQFVITSYSIHYTKLYDGAQTLAQGATEQASAIQQLSASIEDVSSQVQENAIV